VTRNWDPTTVKNKITTIGTGLVLSCLASQTFAAGFQLLEQNVTNLGSAYSGTAALAEDASTGFFNPAGLVRIPDGQVVLSGVVIQASSDFSATSATSPPTTAIGQTLGIGTPMGSGDANPGTVAGIPTFHLAQRLDNRWVFGFNVTAPFGLSTKYDNDSIARYIATESKILSSNFGASIAYQVVPCFSIAAGPDALYVRTTLSAQTHNGFNVNDGFQRSHADGWGWGYHAGVLWEPTESTRVGVNYRSHFNVHANGPSENLGLVSLATASSRAHTNFISEVRSFVVLPQTATISLYHEFGFAPQLALLGDISWTDWSKFKTLRLRYHRPLDDAIVSPLTGASQNALLTPDSDTWENFRDARRYALGLTYTYDDCWLFRIGGAYDETPVRNEFRTARLPDADRYTAAIGAAYTLNKAWRFDVGYQHIFFKGATIDERAPFAGQSDIPLTPARLTGDYDTNANLFGIQVRYDFI
jgi:long-chain fatty acid transport protein